MKHSTVILSNSKNPSTQRLSPRRRVGRFAIKRQRRDLSRRSTIGAVTRLAVHPQEL